MLSRRLGLLVRTAVLLGAGAVGGLVVNALRPQGISPRTFVAETTCGAEPAAVKILPPAQAARLCGDPGVLIADVRPPERFAEGHVADAVHLPCAASGDLLGRALSAAAGKHTLVVYGDSTADASLVAASLRQKLARPELEVVVLEGGFAAWNAEGLACSSGPCPECGRLHAEQK